MMLYGIFALLLALKLAIIVWPIRNRPRVAALVCALFFIGAFGLYRLVGTPEMVPLLVERELKIIALKENIVKNSELLKANPKNLPAWIDLGQSFIETGQYAAAANALKQAVLLSGGDPRLILAYAKALIMEAGGKVGDDAKKGLEMVLLQGKKNPEARYFLAVRKLQDGKTEQAMKDMKALYRSLPKDSPLKATIDRQIGR